MIYRPLTATPFKKNISYTELPPCPALWPYVRCFWGTERPVMQDTDNAPPEIVIPDTCADIIYRIDYTDNTVSGGFCGVNDRSFYAQEGGKPGHLTATFAIRFYAWGAYAFSEDSLRATLNGYFDAGMTHEWLDKALRPRLLELRSLQERAAFAQQLLLQRADSARENRIVDTTVRNILLHKGSLGVSALARDAFVSTRQLERLFHEYIGVTPKKLSNLIRYQYLWRDILSAPDFDVLNAVCKYGFADQAHLLREFKRYHSMDIRRARAMAFENVGNLQDVFHGSL